LCQGKPSGFDGDGARCRETKSRQNREPSPTIRTPDDGKKVSKFFRIGVEGDTCDGRVISATDIQEMAAAFDPASTAAASIWNTCAAFTLTAHSTVTAM
jgi:hypothetical protein